MLTEKQFRAALRAHVDEEASAIFVERPGGDYIPVHSPDEPRRRTFQFLAAASCTLLAAAGAAAWIGFSMSATQTLPAMSTGTPRATQDAPDPSAVMAAFDGSFGMYAALAGDLQETEGCLSIGGTVVVLNSNEWAWDGETGVLRNSLTGVTYQFGDPIELGGGPMSAAEFEEVSSLPAQCASYEGEVFVD